MTGADLIELVLADYLSTTFPPEPGARLAGLRDLVHDRWHALPPAERIQVAADLDLDHTGRLLADEDQIAAGDLDAHDEAVVDSAVNVIRARIPELSVED